MVFDWLFRNYENILELPPTPDCENSYINDLYFYLTRDVVRQILAKYCFQMLSLRPVINIPLFLQYWLLDGGATDRVNL